MKKWIRKSMAMLLVMMLALSVAAIAEKETASESFRLPEIGYKVTEEPVVTPEPTKIVEELTPVEPDPTPAPTAEPTVKPTRKPTAKPTNTVTLAPTAAPVMAFGDADVRLAADGLSEIFVTIPDGTALNVLGVEGDWVMVDVDGAIGYIYIDSVANLVLPEPTATPIPDPEATVEPEFKVTIFTSRRTVMAPGETVYLTSKLEGFEGYTVSYQWQYDRGNGFEDVPGATADTYEFEASVETLSYDWSLLVFYE